MENLFFNKEEWTLFLDRDGVLNQERKNDYVKNIDELIPKENNIKGLGILSSYFNKIIIVTNQKGISKGLYSEKDLENIHDKLLTYIFDEGGRIDKIYYSKSKYNNDYYRKPNPGMAELAKKDFPIINFSKSIMVGDTFSDMLFGRNLGMTNLLIPSQISSEFVISENMFDYKCSDLIEFGKNFNLT